MDLERMYHLQISAPNIQEVTLLISLERFASLLKEINMY